VIVLGLTGSIGMGKSTIADVLKRLGVPVHDADAAVHKLLGRGGRAVAKVAALFPDALKDGAIDRRALGRLVFGDPGALARLETILHPLVRSEEKRFLARHRRAGEPIVALDIPLLYETGGETRCDAVIVVTAPRRVQLGRVLRRAGMTRQRLAAIEARQTSDAEKRRRADYLVPTGLGKRESHRRVARILRELRRRRR
jgi:dephospho-CoA kinase